MHVSTFPPCTQLPNGVKVAVSDQSQKCQKLTKVDLACNLHSYVERILFHDVGKLMLITRLPFLILHIYALLLL